MSTRHASAPHNKDAVVAFVDGGCFGSPGPSGTGVVIRFRDGTVIHASNYIGHSDNNCAEYQALYEALVYASERKTKDLFVYCDSEVVVKQMNGTYRCQSPRLREMYLRCMRKSSGFRAFTIVHIARDKNREANELAEKAARSRCCEFKISHNGN